MTARAKVRPTPEPCVVADCGQPDYCREMCHLHYYRWLRNGSTELKGRRVQAPSVYFWAKVDKSQDCWLWQGVIDHGYGRFRGRGAHRWLYEQERGPLPARLTLDHLCRNRACVRLDHLEPVTHAENCRRAAYRRSTCSEGHAVEDVEEGRRVCRPCANRRNRAYKRRQPKIIRAKSKGHGRSRYVHDRCRCEICVRAQRDYSRQRRGTASSCHDAAVAR